MKLILKEKLEQEKKYTEQENQNKLQIDKYKKENEELKIQINQINKEYAEKCRVNPHKDKLIRYIFSIDKRD